MSFRAKLKDEIARSDYEEADVEFTREIAGTKPTADAVGGELPLEM